VRKETAYTAATRRLSSQAVDGSNLIDQIRFTLPPRPIVYEQIEI
jgi:hypothetical protein